MATKHPEDGSTTKKKSLVAGFTRAFQWLSPRNQNRKNKPENASGHRDVVVGDDDAHDKGRRPRSWYLPVLKGRLSGLVHNGDESRRYSTSDGMLRTTRGLDDALGGPRAGVLLQVEPRGIDRQKIQASVAHASTETTSTPSQPSFAPLDIIIVGGGIGGLAAGFLLGKAGHKVTIVEAAAKFSEVGAGIQLSPNVTRLLQRWGLGDKLKQIAVEPQGLKLCRYEDGEMIGWTKWGEVIERDHGAPYYHVHRADLLEILVEAATPVTTMRLDSRVVDIDPTVPSVRLASGETMKARLVIGADGLHSQVRDGVVGTKDSPTATGDAAYRATIPAELLLSDPDLKSLIEDQNVTVWMGPGRHVVGYCIRNKELYNLVMVHPAHEQNETVRETSLETMKADFEQFEPRVRKMLELVPAAMVWSLMDRQALDSWIHEAGKVCLLGDACHPMLPYRAQGAAMALEDAAVLANILAQTTSQSSMPSLLKAYEKLRHARATQTQAASRLNQHIFHLPDGPAQRVRDTSMRMAMEVALREARGEPGDESAGSSNQWADKEKTRMAFGYDADAEVEKWRNDQIY